MSYGEELSFDEKVLVLMKFHSNKYPKHWYYSNPNRALSIYKSKIVPITKSSRRNQIALTIKECKQSVSDNIAMIDRVRHEHILSFTAGNELPF